MLNLRHKKIEAEKNREKDGKTLHKLMNDDVFGKTMEKLVNRNDVRLVSKEKVI